MIATSHVIIGGAIGIATKNPALGFTAGVVSHIICDAIPHLDGPIHPNYKDDQIDQVVWSRGLYTFAIIDSLIAFFLTFYLWQKYFGLDLLSPFAWGALGAYLPDLIDVFPLWKKFFQALPGFRQFHQLHIAVHLWWTKKFPMHRYWPLGIATQLLLALPALYYIVK